MKIIAKERQTLLDIALLTGGHIETVLALAEANSLCVSDPLEDGQELVIPEPMQDGNSRTVELYRAYHIEPATDANGDDVSACPYGGIGFMGIEFDFTVS